MSDHYKVAEANRKKANLVWAAKMKNTSKNIRDDKITAIMCQAVDADNLTKRPISDAASHYLHKLTLQGLYDAGYVVAPAKPTKEMIQAGQYCFEGCHYDVCANAAEHIWSDMIKVLLMKG